MANYILRDIGEVTARMKNLHEQMEQAEGRKIGFDEFATRTINQIAVESKKQGVISLENQHLIGALLGSMLHSAYCETRRLERPNEDGLINNPREKKLTDNLDAEFVQKVLNGEIPQSKTLYVKNGVVCMDIANTEFVNLSPYWQKDNYMAGKTAARSVITCWDGLTHDMPEVQKFVSIAVANGIHESWISRDNIYYDEGPQGEIYTNMDLDNAYIFLPDDEKAKDLEHMKMAMKVIGSLVREMGKTKQQNQDKNLEENKEVEENQPE